MIVVAMIAALPRMVPSFFIASPAVPATIFCGLSDYRKPAEVGNPAFVGFCHDDFHSPQRGESFQTPAPHVGHVRINRMRLGAIMVVGDHFTVTSDNVNLRAGPSTSSA